MKPSYWELHADAEIARPAEHPDGAGQILEGQPLRLEHGECLAVPVCQILGGYRAGSASASLAEHAGFDDGVQSPVGEVVHEEGEAGTLSNVPSHDRVGLHTHRSERPHDVEHCVASRTSAARAVHGVPPSEQTEGFFDGFYGFGHHQEFVDLGLAQQQGHAKESSK
jgi:hypothetical protein